jgi:hypothetical protein
MAGYKMQFDTFAGNQSQKENFLIWLLTEKFQRINAVRLLSKGENYTG